MPGIEPRLNNRGHLTRRKFISVVAASTPLLLAGAQAAAGRTAPTSVRWHGRALGSRVQITLVHSDRGHVRDVLRKCVREIEQLESLFSLYRADSALNRLNVEGVLEHPDFRFLELLSVANGVSQLTNGAFDVSVQTLWTLYHNHFAAHDANADRRLQYEIQKVLQKIDYRQIQLAPDYVRVGHGMALTLNGIAQGYITDQVAALLRKNGFHDCLVNLGESFGSGKRSDGSPWTAGVCEHAHGAALIKRVELQDRAIATSSSIGYTFDRNNNHHHIFNPKTGRSSNIYKSMSVVAPTATLADAYSTAFACMDPQAIRDILETVQDLHVIYMDENLETVTLAAGS